MVGVAAVLVLVTISVVITRVGAIALEATGMSSDLAHFQARSAFTGVGYTTAEAETVMQHPVRRRIVLTLMLLGNAGIVSVVASLVLGFTDAGPSTAAQRLAVLLGGLVLLWMLTSTSALNALVRWLIQTGVRRWTDVEVRDYVQLLDIAGDYAVRELQVKDGDWLADTALRELDLPAEGVTILAVRRSDHTFIGAPAPDLQIRPGDSVLLYGRQQALEELVDRLRGPAGDAEHERGVLLQQQVQASEQARDERGADARGPATQRPPGRDGGTSRP